MLSYRVDEQKVRTQLFHFSERTVERLEAELGGLARDVVIPDIKAAWAPHRKDGDLEASLRASVKTYGIVGQGAFGRGGTTVAAHVVAGGTRKAAHAHLFERGFEGVEQVDSHTRTAPRRTAGAELGAAQLVAGPLRGFTVEAYERQVLYPERGHMKSAVERHEADAVEAVSRAVGGAIAEADLG